MKDFFETNKYLLMAGFFLSVMPVVSLFLVLSLIYGTWVYPVWVVVLSVVWVWFMIIQTIVAIEVD